MGLEVLTADPNSTNLGSYKNPLPSVLPGWKIKVITGDTSCSSTVGPLEAVKLHCEAGGKWYFVTKIVLTYSEKKYSIDRGQEFAKF